MSRRSSVRVEADRHATCTPKHCNAPPLRRRLAAGRNTGTCIPRKLWYVRYMIDGKRFSESYRSEAEAVVRRDVIAAEITLNQDPRRSNPRTSVPSFEHVAHDALRLYAGTRTLRETTLENQQSFLDTHLLPYFQNIHVDSITRITVQEFIAVMRKTLKDSTVAASLPTLRLILDHAVAKGYVSTNPMRGAPLWRADHADDEHVDPFEPEEIRHIIHTSYGLDHDLGVLLHITAQCGLRPGEGLALRRCDIDTVKATVKVAGTFSRNRMGPTKTRGSVRTISMLHNVVDDAFARDVIRHIHAMKFTPMDAEDRLFPYSSGGFGRLWARVMKKSGVRYRKPHALRHAFASILLSRGENILKVQKAGGWRSAATLLRVYAKWIDEGASDRPVVHAVTDFAARSRGNTRLG